MTMYSSENKFSSRVYKVKGEGSAMSKSTKSKAPKQDMPLNVEDERREFIVTLAVSNTILQQILRNESVSMGVMGMRHVSEEDLELLKVAEDESDVQERIEKMENHGRYERFGDRGE